MILKNKYLLILLLSISIGCAQKNQVYDYSGRVEQLENNKTILIGSASSNSFNFTGDKCDIFLKSIDSYEHYNYVSLVLDDDYR